MDRCGSCGAALAGAAGWCGQCFAPRVAGPTVPAALGRVPVRPARPPQPPLRTTRWRKTPTTFGPAGRLACTLALLVPLAFMVVGGLADPFVWGGAGMWLVVVMPWALRDVWKAGRLPAG